MKFRFIEAEKAFSVQLLCRALGVSRSGFYAWRHRKPSRREQRNQLVRLHVRAAFAESRRRHGSPRIKRDLRDLGVQACRHSIARIMRQERLVARPARRFKRPAVNAATPAMYADNVLDRQFSPPTANTVWAGDITYIPTQRGWLYLAVVLDLYSRRVVGWSLGRDMSQKLVVDALQRAIVLRRPKAGLLFHSDRGSQYTSDAFTALLEKHGIRRSMSRKGNCWDNACVESFFSSLKFEWLRGQIPSEETARQELHDYLENFYNQKRRHSYLDFMSPIDYEMEMGVT